MDGRLCIFAIAICTNGHIHTRCVRYTFELFVVMKHMMYKVQGILRALNVVFDFFV